MPGKAGALLGAKRKINIRLAFWSQSPRLAILSLFMLVGSLICPLASFLQVLPQAVMQPRQLSMNMPFRSFSSCKLRIGPRRITYLLVKAWTELGPFQIRCSQAHACLQPCWPGITSKDFWGIRCRRACRMETRSHFQTFTSELSGEQPDL